MARIIVNADDFGYTSGVNRAIAELSSAGVLSSTTLMARGDAWEDALTRLRQLRLSGTRPLAVGCHVVLVDGTSVAPAHAIPSLLGAGVPKMPGAMAGFRAGLGVFVADLLRGRIREAEIETEAMAQIRLLQTSGVSVTHLDTHKHTHMFPGVLRPLLRAALQCGVRAIRNPFEPAWSRAATLGAPLVRRSEVRLLDLLRPGFSRLVNEAGLKTTAGALGVLATGTLDAPTLERIIRAALRQRETDDAEQTTWELVCHPGYLDQDLAAHRTRLQAAREQERATLVQMRSLITECGLVDFSSLTS